MQFPCIADRIDDCLVEKHTTGTLGSRTFDTWPHYCGAFPLKTSPGYRAGLAEGLQTMRMRCLATIATNIEAVPAFPWEKPHRFTVPINYVQPHAVGKETFSISCLKLSPARVSPLWMALYREPVRSSYLAVRIWLPNWFFNRYEPDTNPSS